MTMAPVKMLAVNDLAAAFDVFHGSHPEVADQLESLASRWLAVHDRVGMKMLWEVLRWETGLAGSGGGQTVFRLNNSLTSRYARLLIQRRPEWQGRILTRELRS